MFCEKCGAELKENEQVCVNCGAQNDYYKPASEEKADERTENGVLSIIALIMIVFGEIFLLLSTFIYATIFRYIALILSICFFIPSGSILAFLSICLYKNKVYRTIAIIALISLIFIFLVLTITFLCIGGIALIHSV